MPKYCLTYRCRSIVFYKHFQRGNSILFAHTFRLVSSHVMRIVHNTTMNTQVIKWISYSLSLGSSFTLVGVSLLSRSSRSPLSFLSFLLFLCLGLLDLLRLLDRFSFLTFRSLSESLHIKINQLEKLEAAKAAGLVCPVLAY